MSFQGSKKNSSRLFVFTGFAAQKIRTSVFVAGWKNMFKFARWLNSRRFKGEAEENDVGCECGLVGSFLGKATKDVFKVHTSAALKLGDR